MRTPLGQRRAQAHGASWEGTLDRLHAAYEEAGTALVYRCQPPLRIVGKDSRGLRAVFVSKGPPDYVGMLDGVPLLMEAKSTSEKCWPLSAVTHHQAARLHAWHYRDGFAGVLLRDGARHGWLLPWRALKWAWVPPHAPGGPGWTRPTGPASLDSEDLARIGLAFDIDGWLAPLRGYLQRRDRNDG